MLPEIFIHNEISLDGRIDWMADDRGLYYETIYRWPVDAMLSGSQTILDAVGLTTGNTAADFVPAARNFDDPRQLLVVIDSRGQIDAWVAIRDQLYWRDVVVLCSRATPQSLPGFPCDPSRSNLSLLGMAALICALPWPSCVPNSVLRPSGLTAAVCSTACCCALGWCRV